MTNNKALVLCSGGVDSTTLLARAVSKYGAENVYALSISYGQSTFARLRRPAPWRPITV